MQQNLIPTREEQHIKGLLNAVRASTFIRHNTVFLVGSIAIGALNYLYYPILGRLLHPAAFGETQALVSLFLQAGIFLSVFGLLTVNVVTNHGESPQSDKIILELEKLALCISGALCVLTIVLSRVLQRFFKFDDYLPFIMLSVAVVVTVPFTFRTAYLRGKQYFGLTSIAGILGAAAKLGFSALLVIMHFGTTGAIAGIILAQLLAFVYAAIKAKKHGFSESLRGQLIRLPDIRLIMPELRYALLVLGGSLIVTGLYSVDIVVVKHFFDAHTAGLYAGIAAVARIIFFLTASIAQVLMSSVRLQQSPQKNRHILNNSLLLLLGVGGAALLLFCVAPRFVIGHLMGNTYLAFAGLLPRLSLAILLVSVLNLYITYHMALRRYGIAAVVLVGAAISAVLLAVHHATPAAVVNSLLYSCIALMALLGVWVGTNRLKQVTRSAYE
jgi:O-antigen/teichoic acid export membrane protein